ncbi:MAG: peptidase M16 [Planctomycetes bacterium RBG_16_64_10]|nr:MAG: peptidase M16 [Planctomycetes bacterium RBG_16_64_10]
MTQSIHSHTYENGLVLVAEPMRSLESAAFTFLVPAGCCYDPDDRSGLSAFTCEMALRGAGPRDSRAFVQDLENLGVERAESVSAAHVSYSGATLAGNLLPALAIYADLVRRPHLPADQLPAGRMVVLQDLRAIEDDPAQKVMLELRRRHYPNPWGRPSQGEQQALEETTIDEIRDHFCGLYRPCGTILGVAGRFTWRRLKDWVGGLFGDWCGADIGLPAAGQTGAKQTHMAHPSNQTQIGIAYRSVPYRHPDYFQAWGSVGVLSGGMSSRLFTEVRERRGLCYSVYASLHTQRDRACVLCYAGTSADRAQETLDVTLAELRRLAAGIEPVELDRLKARIKSALIMQQESSSARSGALARDWYHLGQARTLDEIGRLVDELSCEGINAYLAANPPDDFTLVTVGPSALKMPVAAL